MKLVSYLPGKAGAGSKTEMYALRQNLGRAGILQDGRIYDLAEVCAWAQQNRGLRLASAPTTVLDFVSLAPEERQALIGLAKVLANSSLPSLGLPEVRLRAPLEVPPSVRDFYAFEQHVKTARANRGLGMIPEWYQFPVY